jgi:hypothetical protein
MNSSASQAAFSVLGMGTVEHVLGVIESELKKKQEDAKNHQEKPPQKSPLLKMKKKKRQRQRRKQKQKQKHEKTSGKSDGRTNRFA